MTNNKINVGMKELVALLDQVNELLDTCINLDKVFQDLCETLEPVIKAETAPDNVIDIRRRLNKDPNEVYNKGDD